MLICVHTFCEVIFHSNLSQHQPIVRFGFQLGPCSDECYQFPPPFGPKRFGTPLECRSAPDPRSAGRPAAAGFGHGVEQFYPLHVGPRGWAICVTHICRSLDHDLRVARPWWTPCEARFAC